MTRISLYIIIKKYLLFDNYMDNNFTPDIWEKVKSEDYPFIIAEIGKNFIQTPDERPREEYLTNAKELIKKAKEAGADAVKFQTHNAEDEQSDIEITSPHFSGSDRYSWVRRNTLATPLEFWQEIKKYCDELGIVFFSTPMSRGAAVKLEKAGVPLWKVGSGDILDFVLLDYLAGTGKPIIISSGMSTLEEVDKAVYFLKSRTDKVALLHCVSKYPCQPSELNLGTINFLRKRYDLPTGFSDHSLGHDSAVAAVNLGARIIEKHFSLSRDLWGADHKVSMTPDEFKAMVESIRSGRKVDLADYGTEEKILNEGEAIFRPFFRKTLTAGREIKGGEILTAEMIYAMRPQAHLPGLPSEDYESLLGRPVKKDLRKYEAITSDILGELPALSPLSVAPHKRRICFVMTSFIHYSRNLLILEELNKRPDVELHIIIGGAVLLSKYASKYSNIEEILKNDGFANIHEVYFNLEGSKGVTKAKTAGLGVIEFSSLYEKIKPDLVVVRGDRFEVLSAALAAAYMNIPIAHIEGGDVSGTIDESVRHAITKLAHIHFATNEPARERVLRMGEQPQYVFNFGSPEIEVAFKLANGNGNEVDLSQTGSGALLAPDANFLMVMYHPVTTELEKISSYTKILLEAVHGLDLPTLWFWPNYDAGAEEISHELRIFANNVSGHKIRFMRYLPPKKFLSLLKNTSCLVGNSSAGIKECSYLGIPVVNVGSRQKNRLRADNVMDVEHQVDAIREAVQKQTNVNRYPSSSLYWANDTSRKIAEILATIDLYIQKSFID